MYGRGILILVPHPDDEVVGAALAIRRARARGAAVVAIDLTHGRPPRETAWRWARGAGYDRLVSARRAEAQRVASELGMVRIADTGIAARHLRFHLAAAHRRVLEAIGAHAIDTIWVPAYEGAHSDHDCANALAASLARAGSGAPAAWEFAEYNRAGGRLLANEFPRANGTEQWIEAADAAEVRWKDDLLAHYGSERANLARAGARGHVRRECFRPLPAHDYGAPPHAGLLFYERYWWVPFRHPRLDRTRAAVVTESITAFLNGLKTA